MLSLKFSDEKNKAERENLLLTTATSQAAKEIEQLSFSQKQSSIYRHDLRHHMNFIKTVLKITKLHRHSLTLMKYAPDLKTAVLSDIAATKR